jgi:SAM-dependent methyltransferase
MEAGMTSKPEWKQRLYDCYVSSGQAGDSERDSPSDEAANAIFSRGGPARFVARHMPADPDTRIIDLGCGRGALLYSLRQAGYRNVSGVDASEEQIAIAHRRGLKQAQHGRIEDFLSSVKDSSADVVLLIDVLEHMTREEMFLTLDGVIRILVCGGRCIAHVPNAEGLYGMRVRYGDLTHEQAFTAGSASQLFSAIGFSAVKCYQDPPPVNGGKSLARRILWTLGSMPYRLLLTAETGRHNGLILTQNMFVEAIK